VNEKYALASGNAECIVETTVIYLSSTRL